MPPFGYRAPDRKLAILDSEAIRRGSWNEELFRILEGFPELAHDDEVDACSGALEMLNAASTTITLVR